MKEIIIVHSLIRKSNMKERNQSNGNHIRVHFQLSQSEMIFVFFFQLRKQ